MVSHQNTGQMPTIPAQERMTETEISQAQLRLPEAPHSEPGPVKAWEESVVMRTYLPGPPDRNPLFLEKRVYQGSSGRIYPLPVIDRIDIEPQEHAWKAIHLENEFIRIMVLPEIGGRIHVGLDKQNGYDFFYRQNVIKPAIELIKHPGRNTAAMQKLIRANDEIVIIQQHL